ncbi:MAG: hypothetical protein IK990_17370 [Ruminiclostridium sp.]|nr:hypothetical protein [Ruminiclostridium sp.]
MIGRECEFSFKKTGECPNVNCFPLSATRHSEAVINTLSKTTIRRNGRMPECELLSAFGDPPQRGSD